MSFYSDYIKEFSTDHIYETEYGFATYRYLDDKTVYIIDIYVVPSERHNGVASSIADYIVHKAKEKGCTKLLGSVIPTARTSTASLKVLLGYGMSLKSAADNIVIFQKDI